MVVVPTYDERDNIERLVADILAQDEGIEVLVVDDDSPDGTGEIVDRKAAGNPRLHALHRPGKLGLGSAYCDGFRLALDKGAEYIVEMDADFSHDPAMLVVAIRAVENVVAVKSEVNLKLNILAASVAMKLLALYGIVFESGHLSSSSWLCSVWYSHSVKQKVN